MVWWVDETTGNTIYQQRKIVDYGGGDRKAEVDSNWDINPPIGADFAVGSQEFSAEPNSFPKAFRHRFAHVAPYNFAADRSLYEPARHQPLPGPVAAKTLFRGAYYQARASEGNIRSTTTDGGTTVKLDNSASTTVDFYKDQYIMLYENVLGRMVPTYHRKITAYSAGRVATLDRPLGPKILTSGTDRYAVGGKTKGNSTPEAVRKFAFWGKDNVNRTYAPVNFTDGSVPYTYITFKGGQERRT